MRLPIIILLLGIGILVTSCYKEAIQKDGKELAALQCKQSQLLNGEKIFEPAIRSQIDSIQKKIQEISDRVKEDYGNDIYKMETFALAYKEETKKCK